MIVLKDIKQINDKLEELFTKKLFEDDDEKFISENLSDEELRSLVAGTPNFCDRKQCLEQLADLIFQLKDYIPALCNLTKMFLYSENYEAVYSFVTRLFIAHIGTVSYQSVNGNYTIRERYFDRFVEIVKNCNISHESYMPLLLEIFKTEKPDGLAQWRAPAVEYLQTFFNKNEEWALNFLRKNISLKYDLIESVSIFNTTKGVSLAIDDYCLKDNVDKVQVLHILKKYKRETLSILDKQIAESEDGRRQSLIELLCEFDNDIECMSRLNELYTQEKNELIKQEIASKIGVVESLSIKNEKQFIYAVRKNIVEPQERSLNVGFDKLQLRYVSGYETDNAGKTFLIYLFKQEKNLFNLVKLDTLKTIFVEEDLSNFSYRLFQALKNKDDINQAKWLERMVSLLANEEQIDRVIDFCIELKSGNRLKELKYLTACLLYSKRKQVIRLLKVFKNEEIIDGALLDEYIALYSKFHSVDEDEVRDMLVPENYTQEQFQQEKDRLFLSFIAGRTYNEERFSQNFILNPLMNALGSGLVFGEYLLGNLYSVFVIENGKKKFLVGNEIADKKKVISIVHSLDLDARFEGIVNYIQNPTFKQFAKSRFNVSEFSRNSISVNSFCGMFVSLSEFARQLETYGFVINKAYDEIEFCSFVNITKNLNICTELVLEKNAVVGDQSATLAEVHFMRLDDILCDKNKYLTTKANSISVGSLPYRYFDFVLNAIYECAHNNIAK